MYHLMKQSLVIYTYIPVHLPYQLIMYFNHNYQMLLRYHQIKLKHLLNHSILHNHQQHHLYLINFFLTTIIQHIIIQLNLHKFSSLLHSIYYLFLLLMVYHLDLPILSNFLDLYSKHLCIISMHLNDLLFYFTNS